MFDEGEDGREGGREGGREEEMNGKLECCEGGMEEEGGKEGRKVDRTKEGGEFTLWIFVDIRVSVCSFRLVLLPFCECACVGGGVGVCVCV